MFLDVSTWFDTEARRLSTLIHPVLDSANTSPHESQEEHTDSQHISTAISSSLDSDPGIGPHSESSDFPRLDSEDSEYEKNVAEALPPELGLPPFSPGHDSLVEIVDTPRTPDGIDHLQPYPANERPSLTYYTPTEESSVLLNHYFSTICQINSAFDSLYNPFRSEVSRMMLDSPLLFYCVMSMSAAHLYQGDKQKSDVPLQFQTKEISQLSSRVSEINDEPWRETSVGANNQESLIESRAPGVKDDVLLGIVLLGMTSVSPP